MQLPYLTAFFSSFLFVLFLETTDFTVAVKIKRSLEKIKQNEVKRSNRRITQKDGDSVYGTSMKIKK